MTTAFEYHGFRNLPDRREYSVSVRNGAESRQYTVWIPIEAFAAHKAQMQDGPDICFRKIQQLQAEFGDHFDEYIGVSAADLQSYKEAHTVTPRRKPVAPKLPNAS